MRLTFYIFVFLSLSCCFAQTNSMEYFYECQSEISNFAALAVLEKQNCPRPVYLSYEKYKEQTCTSRYRIIKVLDAASDTLRKEYIEVKEKPVSPYFRHRPMLIFGKHENDIFEVKKYEEVRGYFYPIIHKDEIRPIFDVDNSPRDTGSYFYTLHSIGSPYHNLKNLDSIDIIFYKYLMPEVKYAVKKAKKDFGKLQQRLFQNRDSIKAIKIKNDFAALGIIKNMRSANVPKQASLYELNITIATVFKNDAKLDSNIAIYIDRKHFPLNFDCLASETFLLTRKPFYFFGNLKDGSLFIDSLIFPRDAFVFGDTIYDISMGLPLKELFSYFLPSNTSIDELEFAEIIRALDWSEESECMKKDIERTLKIWIDVFDYYNKEYEIAEVQKMKANVIEYLDEETRKLLQEPPSLNYFRCPLRRQNKGSRLCCQSNLKSYGVWGRKW